MLLVTAREMRDIDRRAIEGLGVPGLELMEEAGRSVAEEALALLGDPSDKAVILLCGRGNNGGDGLVASRHLHERGVRVRPFLVGEGERQSPDARTNLERLQKLGITPEDVREEGDLTKVKEAAREAALLVEALFGTGLSRAPSGVAAEVVRLLEDFPLPVLAVDLPTGVHADTGEILDRAVRADVTVTLALPKLGLYLYPGRSMAGRVVVADIGMPAEAISAGGVTRLLFDEEEARRVAPRRPPDAHKGVAGHVLLVAGSPGLTGAAALAALGALRVGAGLVTVAVPRSLNPILETKLTEAMTLPVVESDAGTHSARSRAEIQAALSGKQAAAVGPGLSRHPEAADLARELITCLEIPLVLDADGLNAFAGRLELLRDSPASLIVTPHPGEMSRLIGRPAAEVVADRLGTAVRVAEDLGAVVVLKGAPTVVAEPGGEHWVNPTGNAGLASGGAGDVLTGAILGFLSQGLEPGPAARLGVYLHGLAADLLAEEGPEIGFLAGEVADTLPWALETLREGNRHAHGTSRIPRSPREQAGGPA